MSQAEILPHYPNLMKTIEYLGQSCIELSNGGLTLAVTESVGPRVLSLRVENSPNIFAQLPDTTLECPGKGTFHLYGGHRLWHAPEEPSRTYLPDDRPIEVLPLADGVWVKAPVEPETDIQKGLKIQLKPGSNRVQIEHILENKGVWPVTCAPWAITQMAPGGTALLPQNTDLWDDNPTLPNRPVVLWPYTDINNPAITWGNDVTLVQAKMREGMLKIGYPNPRGWLAYWLDGTLFIKRAGFDPKAQYFDFGCSSECYCNPQFLELETLGPVTTLKPGEIVSHLETWEAHAKINWPSDVNELLQFIEQRG